MDSITQFALGAAIGEAVLGKKAGFRAALVGGAVASLPDLDVIYPYANAVAAFTWHRGVTHSIFVLALFAPLVAWLLQKTPITSRGTAKEWRLLVFLALLTHPLLDAFTVYGTQIFWPIPIPPATWSTLFIIDPFVTAPLLLGILGARLAYRHGQPLAAYANFAGIAFIIAYLTWSIGAKFHVDQVARETLRASGIEFERIISTPLPFGTRNWRLVAMTPDAYLQGIYRLGGEIRFEPFDTSPELLKGLPAQDDIARLKWFSKGFYSVRLEGDEIIYTDLRMGSEPFYVFRFVVGPDHLEARQLQMSFDLERFARLRESTMR